MTLFYYAVASTRGNWFQTNQPEHESDDRAGDTGTSVCVLPMRKILHFSGKFEQHLWYSKTEITDGTGILVLVRYDFQNLLTFLA